MANAIQHAGGAQEPSPSAPLYTSRMFTGWYTNRSPLRDGVTTHDAEKAGYGRQDSILDGRNMEITPRLTLARRAGTTGWGAVGNTYRRINRFYSFNTFTLTNEVIRVMADEPGAVYDTFDGSQKNLIWTKTAPNPTFFLGVGNTLFFTNGVDNKQWVYGKGVYDWGIYAPTTKPAVDSTAVSYPGSWAANTVYSRKDFFVRVAIVDPNGNVQNATTLGTTGASEPAAWDTRPFYSTIDGGVTWQNYGNGAWLPNHGYSANDLIYRAGGDGNTYMFQATINGVSGGVEPTWPAKVNTTVIDNQVTWTNIGRVLRRADIGNSTLLSGVNTITDASGNIQSCIQAGKSGATLPTFGTAQNAITQDPGATPQGAVLWQTNILLPVYYGYAYENSTVIDISGMSPKSDVIYSSDGQSMHIQGMGSGQAGVDKIIVYRTLHGGSTFFKVGELANPGAGVQWSFVDTVLDANLNIFIQAQINGEGTPLPAGATCLAYHLGRIFAAVGNVVWASAGPDAAASASSGNAGFAISFTCQSKVIRLWPTSIGLIVFTVRDAYIILGNGVDIGIPGGTGLFIKVWIENLPLLNYDAFTTFGTTAFLFTGKNMVISLDPGAGIVEVSQPIADKLEGINPQTAYLTYHSRTSRDTALYLGNGQDTWYRLNPSIAPEAGFAWSLPATPVRGMSALQSVEVTPGVYELLMGPKTDGGKIYKRDTSVRTDDGAPFPSYADFGVITLASPGQLAGIGWMNLEAWNTKNEPKLSMLMGELMVGPTTPLEPVKRTRHDPPNLPPAITLDSTRYSFLRGGSTIWCRHMIFRVDFGTAATFDELLSFTIFGSVYQEYAA